MAITHTLPITHNPYYFGRPKPILLAVAPVKMGLFRIVSVPHGRVTYLVCENISQIGFPGSLRI